MRTGRHPDTAEAPARRARSRAGDRAFRRGLAEHRAGRLDDAASHYGDALRRNQGHAEALHHLGLVAHGLGDHDAAIGLIENALALRPWYPEASANLALPLNALGRRAEALGTLSLALAMEPDFVDALYNLGVTQEQGGDFEAAIASYRAVVARDPTHADALCNLGILLHARREWREAVASYRAALLLSADLRRLHVYLSIALCQTGNFENAIASARRAVAAEPGDAAAWVALADALYYGGDLPASLPPLAEALRCLLHAGAANAPWVEMRLPSYSQPVFNGAMQAVVACLARAGIDAFLTGGTLLGAIREGDFISFDKDIDFGFFDDVPVDALAAAFATDPDFSFLRRNGPEPVIVTYSWRQRVAIDFFRFTREPDTTWCGLYYGDHLIKWRHHPFGLVDFTWHGVSVRIPDDVDRFLTEDYGAWRQRNPYFHMFASPCIEGDLPPICRSLAYTAIFSALVQRDRERSVNLCEQVLELDPSDQAVRDLREAIAASAPGDVAAAPHDPASGIIAQLGRRREQ